jgi:hypothetical protein
MSFFLRSCKTTVEIDSAKSCLACSGLGIIIWNNHRVKAAFRVDHTEMEHIFLMPLPPLCLNVRL